MSVNRRKFLAASAATVAAAAMPAAYRFAEFKPFMATVTTARENRNGDILVFDDAAMSVALLHSDLVPLVHVQVVRRRKGLR